MCGGGEGVGRVEGVSGYVDIYLNTAGVAKLKAVRFSVHSGWLCFNSTASTEDTAAPRECPVSTIRYLCKLYAHYGPVVPNVF